MSPPNVKSSSQRSTPINPAAACTMSKPRARPTVRGHQSARKALDHYRKLLAIRPDSYWGNYRAAGVCYVLGDFAAAAKHLDRCLAIRPDNAAIRGQRGACLAWLERYPEALQECDQALNQAPDLPELYRTRAFIRAASGQTSGLGADLQHFELLSRILPRNFLDQLHREEPVAARTAARDDAGQACGALQRSRSSLRPSPIARVFARQKCRVLPVDPSELSIRLVLASKIRDAGDRELASTEYAKVLLIDPGHIPARTSRALTEIKDERFGAALLDLEVVLNHPRLVEYLRRNPPFLAFLARKHRGISSAGTRG